ncbi:MAG: CAP domain-containing protein [Sporolactobacillus sp.]|jgi:uncharacterized YkwD family protein|nr:CAP domain-containing protein [Sporolactobacillus sp.]
MIKKILALTLAGAIALPFISTGQAEAAKPAVKTTTFKFVRLFNPWKLKDGQISDLDEILSRLGISVDWTAPSQAAGQSGTPAKEKPKSPEKEQQPDSSAPAKTAVPAKPAGNQEQSQTQEQPKPAKNQQPEAEQPSKQEEQPSSETAGDLSAYEKKVVDLTNAERTKTGLKALKADNGTLSKMARAKSADMRDKNYFDHQSPTYGSPFDMMKQYGITYRSAGENIAAGQKTPEEVVNGWMNSPGHRANILNANFTTIGVGYVSGGSYGSYWTQEFIGN